MLHEAMSKQLKIVAVAILVLAVFAVLIPGIRQSSAQEEGQYAGIEQCAMCHEDTVKAFQDSIHGQKGFALRSDKACESCHGPAAAHVEGGGDKTKIKSFASLNTQEKSDMCLGCHERGKKMFWMGSAHESRGLACQDCHSVHKPAVEKAQLKKKNQSQLCFDCHKQKEAQFFRPSHHPVKEGKMECTSCHNPHGTQTAKLLTADSVTEQCYQCHAEKRGPFLWEHVPVREDCTNCHEVHGSNRLKLLNAKEPFLCQRCHSDTRHPGTPYDETRVTQNRIAGHSCTNCHSTLHGSNHPSGHTFLR
ncbi:MAG: hypothetical protein A2Y62_15805 [Candidatus Fischerbacteria bacterium RBG_13_37_8]|uniref:Uncharacterized protein n=1 Tax=Candidatus Fischerbacteria bacterium RBG_13_37_8 TaxID=1817863 RepID=A0A1F5VVD0_9BACT|nr:MAG: hypothetical protein A2Y62_15805 [Candidatus Fischerbacteria bacterium RBG_13_37_8]